MEGNVSIRYGPHVVGRYTATGQPRQAPKPWKRGAVGTVETTDAAEPGFLLFHRSERTD